MEGVTGTMAWLSHVPGCSRAGLYGPANIDFRFVKGGVLKNTGFCRNGPYRALLFGILVSWVGLT